MNPIVGTVTSCRVAVLRLFCLCLRTTTKDTLQALTPQSMRTDIIQHQHQIPLLLPFSNLLFYFAAVAKARCVRRSLSGLTPQTSGGCHSSVGVSCYLCPRSVTVRSAHSVIFLNGCSVYVIYNMSDRACRYNSGL